MLRLLLRREPRRGEESPEQRSRPAGADGARPEAQQCHLGAGERAAATFLWRSGALRSALDGLSLKIRKFGQIDFKARGAQSFEVQRSPIALATTVVLVVPHCVHLKPNQPSCAVASTHATRRATSGDH